jgi:YHS domain-containing protein
MIARVDWRGVRRLFVAPVLFALSFVLGASGSVRAEELINQTYDGGVAIQGYDPVAYFIDGQAVKGSDAFSYEWLGATWHFASAEHRDQFSADPVSYAPQYGGYCSDGMADGMTTGADPEAWRIVDGKLYLFASKSGSQLWTMHAPGSIGKADAQWEVVKAGLTE